MKSNVILRGLRATSDFEYEFQLSGMNKKLNENSYLFIKINKIHQDKRIDLPTIGYKTVNYLVKSNIKYIILQADSTIILNKKKIFKLIKKFKKTIISVNINYFPHNNNCYIEF